MAGRESKVNAKRLSIGTAEIKKIGDNRTDYTVPVKSRTWQTKVPRLWTRGWTKEQAEVELRSDACMQNAAQHAYYAVARAVRRAHRLGIVCNVDPHDVFTGAEKDEIAARGNLTRCFDTGATQGMSKTSETARTEVGPTVTIETGAGPVTTNLYEIAQLTPDISMKHVCMPSTSHTVSIGDLNRRRGYAYHWEEPVDNNRCGETYVLKSLDEYSHTVIHGWHEVWPLKVTVQTPEREDSDPIHKILLHHCATPKCKCKLPKMSEVMQRCKLGRALVGGAGELNSAEEEKYIATGAKPPVEGDSDAEADRANNEPASGSADGPTRRRLHTKTGPAADAQKASDVAKREALEEKDKAEQL